MKYTRCDICDAEIKRLTPKSEYKYFDEFGIAENMDLCGKCTEAIRRFISERVVSGEFLTKCSKCGTGHSVAEVKRTGYWHDSMEFICESCFNKEYLDEQTE